MLLNIWKFDKQIWATCENHIEEKNSWSFYTFSYYFHISVRLFLYYLFSFVSHIVHQIVEIALSVALQVSKTVSRLATQSIMSKQRSRTRKASLQISSDWFLPENSWRMVEHSRTTTFRRSPRSTWFVVLDAWNQNIRQWMNCFVLHSML